MGSPLGADDCAHAQMIFDVDVVAFNDTAIRRFIVNGECKHCHRRMRFMGLPYDRPVDEPVTTADALEAHIPFEMVPAAAVRR